MPGGYARPEGSAHRPHESALGVIATPGATPHAEGSAFTQPTRLGLGHDCYARGLHRMLGAPLTCADDSPGIMLCPEATPQRALLHHRLGHGHDYYARELHHAGLRLTVGRLASETIYGGYARCGLHRTGQHDSPWCDYYARGLRRMLGAPPSPRG